MGFLNYLKSRSWFYLSWLGIVFVLCSGFRTFTGYSFWDISNLDSSSRKLFIVHNEGQTLVSNDLPTDDPIAGSGDVSFDTVMTSVISDFNSISGAFYTLVEDDDSDFASLGANRTITVNIKGTGGTTGGEASFDVSGDKVVGCTINLDESAFDSAKSLVQTLTHEMGHCLGLDHPQDTTNAVMSYFVSEDKVRLQIDDKMGLIHLYPVDSDAAKELPTFGLSCSRR